MSDQTVLRIANRITSLSGFKITSRNREKLKIAIAERMKELNISDINFYASKILTSKLEITYEISAVIGLMVNTESYFFRDKGLFDLLRVKIFPEIINRKKQQKELRIWSAGCAGGEEAFSVAICLLQMLPDWKIWNIKILGSDISKNMINVAQSGEYRSNSLRQMDKRLLQHYFKEENDLFKINSSLKEIVSFKWHNLMSNFTLDPEFINIDLIICRNVFIYFDAPAIETVVRQFTKALTPDGILITGHGELIGITHSLQIEMMQQFVVFRNKEKLA